jgi:hypothetical protein
MVVAVWLAGKGGLLTPSATHHPAVHSTSHSQAPKHGAKHK